MIYDTVTTNGLMFCNAAVKVSSFQTLFVYSSSSMKLLMSNISEWLILLIEQFIEHLAHNISVLLKEMSILCPVSKSHGDKLLHGCGRFAGTVPALGYEVGNVRVVAILAHILMLKRIKKGLKKSGILCL